MTEPAYLKLYRTGQLVTISKKLNALLNSCTLCPRQCRVNRMKDELGDCKSGRFPRVSNSGPHYGEERPLVGMYGSGTVFFAHCNLLCIFCQNYDISHFASGHKMSISQLARVFIEIQNSGCHNLNLVTPTHFVPQIIEALVLAIHKGFRLPIVYNCGGYESVHVIKLLDGIVDIYMPDLKFLDKSRSKNYLQVEDYPEIVQVVIKEMFRQVGDLVLNKDGLAERGLLLRYLVMPATTDEELEAIFSFIAEEISPQTYCNIMDQYRPLYKAREYAEINRGITMDEYNNSRQIAKKFGLKRGFN